MSYSFTQTDAHSTISLHDCRANRMEIIGGDVVFGFNDGFCVTPENEANSTGKVLFTGRSQLRIKCAECSEAYVIREKRRFERSSVSIREEIPLEQLAEKINSGEYQLEFIGEYFGYRSALYQCWLWFDHKPYHMECQLEFLCGELEYSWDMETEI